MSFVPFLPPLPANLPPPLPPYYPLCLHPPYYCTFFSSTFMQLRIIENDHAMWTSKYLAAAENSMRLQEGAFKREQEEDRQVSG
jgi:hypothetical protein